MVTPTRTVQRTLLQSSLENQNRRYQDIEVPWKIVLLEVSSLVIVLESLETDITGLHSIYITKNAGFRSILLRHSSDIL